MFAYFRGSNKEDNDFVLNLCTMTGCVVLDWSVKGVLFTGYVLLNVFAVLFGNLLLLQI